MIKDLSAQGPCSPFPFHPHTLTRTYVHTPSSTLTIWGCGKESIDLIKKQTLQIASLSHTQTHTKTCIHLPFGVIH